MQEEIIFEREGTTLRVILMCELDHHHARHLRERVDHRLFLEKPEVLLLDFSRVPFMDSSGVAFILGRAKCARALGTLVSLTGLSRELTRLTGLWGAEAYSNITIKK